jgi:drug/metabolite transporter (DMT)-like permease
MNSRKSVQPSAALSCLGFMICWTIAPLYIKVLTGYVDAWTQNFIRYIVSFVFWMPFLIHTGLRGGLDRQLFVRALLPVAFNVATQSSYAAAFYYADPGFITLVTMTLVFWVALFSMAMFPQERRLLTNAAFWAGVALSGIGVCGVVMFHPQFSARATLVGTLLAAGMAFGWGCYTVSVKRLLGHVDSRVSFSIITVYTVIGHGILAFAWGRPGE